MEVKELLNMNQQGDEEFNYSSLNTVILKTIASRIKPTIERTIDSFLLCDNEIMKATSQVLNIADFGCGFGPTPLALVSTVIETAKTKYEQVKRDDQVPKIHILLNDLPSNDFNSLFRDLSNLQLNDQQGSPLCLVMGVPGSFYGRLFPRNSLHFVHSNYALHMLSQAPTGQYGQSDGVPMNKGNIYISETSPAEVVKAYLAQFEQDLTRFLHCRSKEVVTNGLMLLTFRGRPSSSNADTWHPNWELQILAQAIASLVSQGMIEEEKLDSFDFPYYGANKEEIQDIVEKEGSFIIEDVKTVLANPLGHEKEDKQERANFMGKFMRAFSEPLISPHFGHQVLDALYDKFTLLTFQHLANHQPTDHCIITILLKKI